MVEMSVILKSVSLPCNLSVGVPLSVRDTYREVRGPVQVGVPSTMVEVNKSLLLTPTPFDLPSGLPVLFRRTLRFRVPKGVVYVGESTGGFSPVRLTNDCYR